MTQQEEERQKDLERLKTLRPMDDDFMRAMFRKNNSLTQLVLRIVMQKPDLIVKDVRTQNDLKRLVGARSLELDVYATDSDGRKFDIEIQKAWNEVGKKRARYHSSCMDIDNLNAREEFDKLPDTYVIFILEKDSKKRGRPFYLIQRVDMETLEPEDDGQFILYVNGEYKGDDDFGRLMNDFRSSNPDDMYYSEMRKTAHYLKNTEEGVSTMCKQFEDTRREGEMKHAIETVDRMLVDGILTNEQIAKYAGVTLDFVLERAGQKAV